MVADRPELHAEVVADAYKILAIAVVCGGGDISSLAADAREWSACGLPNIEAADLVKTLRTELYHMGDIRPANVPPLNLESYQVHNVAELVCLALIAYACPNAMQQIHALGDFFECCVDPSGRQMLMTNAHHFRALYAASKIDGAKAVVEYPAI